MRRDLRLAVRTTAATATPAAPAIAMVLRTGFCVLGDALDVFVGKFNLVSFRGGLFRRGRFGDRGRHFVTAPATASAASAAATVLRLFGGFAGDRAGGLGRFFGILFILADDLLLRLGLGDCRGRRQSDLRGDRDWCLAWHLGADAVDAELRRHLGVVAQAENAHAVACLDFTQPLALVVQYIQRDLRRGVHDDLGGAALGTFFLDSTQDMHGGGLGRAHVAGAAAMRAEDEAGFGERWA